MEIIFHPIGTIYSPHKTIQDMPIQPAAARGIKGSIDVFPEFVPALKDVEGFSHIYLVYHFHRVNNWQPRVIPFLDTKERGLFATRAPKRPNPIGLSVVRLLDIFKGRLEVENVDILDGTPLLDIKPYVPKFDNFTVDSIGWLDELSEEVKHMRSDTRFK